MRTPPPPWSIIKTDNVCWAILTSAPMVLFIALVIKFTGTIPGSRGKPDMPVDPAVASMVLACAIALILFLSAIVALRVARVRGLFDAGREVEASVRQVMHFRGARTKLKLDFELNGIPYEVSCTFLRWSGTPAFGEGMRISVLVDAGNPKRAIPLALYADLPSARRGERPASAEGQSWIQESNVLRLKRRE